MRALQRESQFLLGERVVIMRLDRVVGTTQELIRRLAEIASVWVLDHWTRARKRVTLVRLHAWHADWRLLVIRSRLRSKKEGTHHW
jgi:hypothetical protein